MMSSIPLLPRAVAVALASLLALTAAPSREALAQQPPPLPPAQPAAQPADDPGARAALERGIQALNARRFGDALLDLQDALQRRPTALTRYNVGLALRGLGRYAEAVAIFEQYLAAPEAGAQPDRLAAITREVEQLRRSLVRLSVTVTPAHVALRVDGRPVALSNGVLTLDPGTHAIELGAEGFRSDRREVTVAPGGQLVLNVALQATPREAARLQVEPSVTGALVSIDGRSVGTGHVERELPEGEHLVEVRAQGHEPYRRTVRLGATGVLRLDATLSPQRRMAGWVLPVAIGGGALVVGAIVTTVLVVSGGTEDPRPTSWGNVTEAIQGR